MFQAALQSMENKNKNNKHSSFEPQNNQDKAEANMTLGQSNASHDNVPNSNQQQQTSMYQWPYYTSQNSTQAPWQQFPLPQQSHVFWPQLFVTNIPPFFQSFNANGLQAIPIVPEATSSTTQHLVPNMSYHVGYTFPGSLVPWNQSSCLAQMNQLQHPYVPNVVEAQSTETAKLWSMVNKLQAEVSDYKARLTKLEEEVSSLKKHKVEKPINEILSTIPVGTAQPRKRGRPSKKSSNSINALHGSQLAHGRKPAPSQPQLVMKSPIFKTVVLEKVENKEISTHSAKHIGNTGNVNLDRTYRTPSQDSARHVLNATHQQGVNITHGHNFENASKEQKDGNVGSTEDENEEETGDEEGTSSSA
ncbi:hypothetical protein L195_g027611 [Trifolium pratense]|uniref:Uncharacterized protein n=1 Tax=Trifolium pratense TaxID=57577 RepID=A0A2K3KZM4_TRIPR|nr:hypothetical protein L195_g027611 [Trifolium pratense]